MICISEVPEKSIVRIHLVGGRTVEGVVVANYGGSLAVREAKNSTVLMSNTVIESVELMGCDAVDNFEIKHGVEQAKFKQFLESI